MAGNVWIADPLLSSVVKLTVTLRSIQSSASFTAGGIQGSTSLAIDSQNNFLVQSNRAQDRPTSRGS